MKERRDNIKVGDFVVLPWYSSWHEITDIWTTDSWVMVYSTWTSNYDTVDSIWWWEESWISRETALPIIEKIELERQELKKNKDRDLKKAREMIKEWQDIIDKYHQNRFNI